jgi:hypothetical protein
MQKSCILKTPLQSHHVHTPEPELRPQHHLAKLVRAHAPSPVKHPLHFNLEMAPGFTAQAMCHQFIFHHKVKTTGFQPVSFVSVQPPHLDAPDVPWQSKRFNKATGVVGDGCYKG